MGTRDRERNQAGFTLVELMIVLLIVAILVGIVLPTYLGARERAHDAAAKASARLGYTAGRAIFSSERTYAAATIAELSAFDDSVVWVDESTPSTDSTTVSRDITGDVLVLAVYSKSQTCFFLRDEPPVSTTYGTISVAAPADCYAANAGAVPFGPSW
jgi:prepilin-type N-terminal cleavage/methylation domain-containing protein